MGNRSARPSRRGGSDHCAPAAVTFAGAGRRERNAIAKQTGSTMSSSRSSMPSSWNVPSPVHRPKSSVFYLAARLLNEPPFELVRAAGTDRVTGGALAGGEAAPISFNAEAAPVLNAKTCEVRRGCLAHDSSRTMPRRRSAADHAERAMLFLTAQNLRRSGPELAAVQWTPMDHPGKSARSWATSLGGGPVTWSIPAFVTGCPPYRTFRGHGSVIWLTGPRPLRACYITCS